VIKVLLADDHSIVRAGLRRIVEESGEMEVVAEADDGREAIQRVQETIRKIHAGQRYITDEAAEALALRVAKGTDGKSPLDSLSMRELQVLRRLAMGQTNREIARSYHISIKTVDTYRARLLKKLSLRNNAELSRFAIQNRLIEP
jgi:DNA-binding NarL/FixJ family response regulator